MKMTNSELAYLSGSTYSHPEYDEYRPFDRFEDFCIEMEDESFDGSWEDEAEGYEYGDDYENEIL